MDIKNKSFKKLCVCGAMAVGMFGMGVSMKNFPDKNKGKPLIGVTNVPHGHENDISGGALLFSLSSILTGASTAALRKMTKDQGR